MLSYTVFVGFLANSSSIIYQAAWKAKLLISNLIKRSSLLILLPLFLPKTLCFMTPSYEVQFSMCSGCGSDLLCNRNIDMIHWWAFMELGGRQGFSSRSERLEGLVVFGLDPEVAHDAIRPWSMMAMKWFGGKRVRTMTSTWSYP